MKKIRWAEITSHYTGKSYKLGESDCFSILVDILKEIGVNIPNDMEIEGINFRNYTKLWEENPFHAKELMIKFTERIAEEVPLGQRRTGDLLLLTVKNNYKNSYPFPFIGLQVGDKIISATKEFGVKAYKMSHFKTHRVFRLWSV